MQRQRWRSWPSTRWTMTGGLLAAGPNAGGWPELVMSAPHLPGWATSPCMLAQAVQHLDSTGRAHGALEVAIRAGAADPDALRGRHEMDARTR